MNVIVRSCEACATWAVQLRLPPLSAMFSLKPGVGLVAQETCRHGSLHTSL
jgi:hypothetical protein